MQDAGLDQRIVHESVRIRAVRKQAGVDPDFPALGQPLQHAIQRLVESAQLWDPDIAVLLEELEIISHVQGFHDLEFWSELAYVASHNGVGLQLVAVRFIRDVDSETVQPFLLLQVVAQRVQEDAIAIARRRIGSLR